MPFERKQCGEEEMKVLLKDNKVLQIAKEMNSDNLHYLNGKIHVEAKMPRAVVSDSRQATELGERLQSATRDDHEIAEVAICFTG